MTTVVRRSPRLGRGLIQTRGYATTNKETLVVVGGGWAGYNFVRKLDKVSKTILLGVSC